MKHTSIEQSKKLVELGLNPETADCCWFDGEILNETTYPPYHYDIEKMNKHIEAGREVYPCWSVGALLEAIKEDLPELSYGGYKFNNGNALFIPKWFCYIDVDEYDDQEYDGTELSKGEGDTPLEAAYQSTCWLLEHKKNGRKTE